MTINPASAISRATSATRLTFSSRSASLKPRSALSPRRSRSPSSRYAWWPRRWSSISSSFAIVDFPAAGIPVSQITAGCCRKLVERASLPMAGITPDSRPVLASRSRKLVTSARTRHVLTRFVTELGDDRLYVAHSVQLGPHRRRNGIQHVERAARGVEQHELTVDLGLDHHRRPSQRNERLGVTHAATPITAATASSRSPLTMLCASAPRISSTSVLSPRPASTLRRGAAPAHPCHRGDARQRLDTGCAPGVKRWSIT